MSCTLYSIMPPPSEYPFNAPCKTDKFECPKKSLLFLTFIEQVYASRYYEYMVEWRDGPDLPVWRFICWFVYCPQRCLVLQSSASSSGCPFGSSALAPLLRLLGRCSLRGSAHQRRLGFEILDVCSTNKRTGTNCQFGGLCPYLLYASCKA